MEYRVYFMTSRGDYMRCRGGPPFYLTKSHTGALTLAPGTSRVGDANTTGGAWRNL